MKLRISIGQSVDDKTNDDKMEEIDTIFSDDHSFFQAAVVRKDSRKSSRYEDEDFEDYENNPSIYDPPSKICGGAVFSKLRALGKNNNSKLSNDENFDKKHKKTVQYKSQINQNESSPRLINKLAGKIIKRKTKNSDDTEENSSRPSVVMQDSTTLSSMSNPSLSTSPWQNIDDDADDYFDRRSRSKRGIMGESTGKYTNQKPSTPTAHSHVNDTAHSRQSLQNFLKEMKDMNEKVQENSKILQKGIENIAIELEQETTQQPPPTPQQKDDSEMEQLRQERSYYRSEAETLRMEMQEIKEQLSEIRKILPQMGNSFDIPPPPKSVGSGTSGSSGSGAVSTSDESDSKLKQHAQFLETIDLPPRKDPKLFHSEVREIVSDSERRASLLSDSERSVSDSERRARSAIARRAMTNAKYLIQQHHNQPIRSIDNEEGEMSPGVEARPPPTSRSIRSVSPISRRLRERSASPISRRSRDRSMSSVSRQSSVQSDESKKSSKLAIAKNHYKKKFKQREESNLLTADKNYREMRRSLKQEISERSERMDEITTANHPKESLVVFHVQDPDFQDASYSDGDIDDEYLDELRKSWYQKRGLALADSNSSDENRASI